MRKILKLQEEILKHSPTGSPNGAQEEEEIVSTGFSSADLSSSGTLGNCLVQEFSISLEQCVSEASLATSSEAGFAIVTP